MALEKIPGLYYDETAEYQTAGSGGKIPVFIGVTGNSASTGYAVDGTQINKFTKWEDVNRTIANGGIGVWTEETTNILLDVIKDFFEEAEIKSTEDLGIPYIYVIDVGAGTSKNVWLTALTTAKTKPDAIIEGYFGAEAITDTGYTLPDFIAAAEASIKAESTNLNIRNGFTTKFGATDAQLIALNPSSGGILKSRIGIIEPLKVGKIFARICTTPYYIEPGYLEFRTIRPGTFASRTRVEELALQNAGIIFGHDEKVNDLTLTRINLSTSTAFAANPRPADALFHARFNADNLLRRVFEAVYPQVKANESSTNIITTQTAVDAVIDEEVEAERMIAYDDTTGEGTRLLLVESNSQPYDMELSGQIQPINCTGPIVVKAKINNPKIVATS